MEIEQNFKERKEESSNDDVQLQLHKKQGRIPHIRCAWHAIYNLEQKKRPIVRAGFSQVVDHQK